LNNRISEEKRPVWLAPDARRYVIILVVLAAAQVAVEVGFNGFTSFPDTHEYVETVKWYKDGSGEEFPLRTQRPLEILIVLVFEPILGVTSSFALVNSLFYLASIPFFFSFSHKVLRDCRSAFVSTFLYSFSFCVLYWGLALLTDMLVWFLMCVCFDLLADYRENWRMSDLYKIGIVVGLGITNKESIMAVGLILLFLILAKEVAGRKEGKVHLLRYVPPFFIMILPFLLVQLLIYLTFGPGHSFFDYHLTHNASDVRGELWYLPATFLIAFNLLLVFYVLGIKGYIEMNRFPGRRGYIVCLALLLLPVAAFEQYSPRLSFLVFPLIIPVAAEGLNRLIKLPKLLKSEHSLLVLLALYLIANNVVSLLGDEVRDLLGIWSR
jgi:hypothetical protein